MNEPSFEIHEREGSIELTAFGDLTTNNRECFRLHLFKILERGKSKSFKLDLRKVAVIDTCCIELINMFNQHLKAVKASLEVDLPGNNVLNLSSRKANHYDKLHPHSTVDHS